MNTGFLSNPTPDSGYNAVMAALAPHSAPAEGSLGGMNPSVQNRVKQTFVNPVATYPFIAAKWLQGYEQSFHPGDLMFIWKGERTSAASVVLANLPLLNYIMKTTEAGLTKYKNRLNWAYIGVMRNSAVASGRPASLQKARGGNRSAAERIINIDVRGATRMFNYWEHASANDHLYLAWTNVGNVDGRMAKEGFVTKRKREADRMAVETTKELPNGVWQLLPVSSPDYKMQDKNLNILWDTRMNVVPGFHRAISIGYVFQEVGKGERSNHAVAIRLATQLAEERFKLPLIHCFLRV